MSSEWTERDEKKSSIFVSIVWVESWKMMIPCDDLTEMDFNLHFPLRKEVNKKPSQKKL